jgi:hypothetical protein
MIHRTRSLWFASLTLVMFAACSDATPDSPDELSPPETEETLTTSQELTYCSDNCGCTYGSYCASNQCVPDFGPFAPCYCPSRDCPGGPAVCSGGFCQYLIECSHNCDCPYNQHCSGNVCVAGYRPRGICP